MDVQELLSKARDNLTVSRVYSPPVEKDGLTVITAARLAGGGGGGTGQEDGGGGEGGGFGMMAKPAGAFVIDGGKLRWQPAVDVNGAIVATAAVVITLVVARTIRAAIRGRS